MESVSPFLLSRLIDASVDGIWVDGVLAVPQRRIANAIVQPRPGKKPTVRLRNEKQNVVFEMEVEDEAEGLAFLRTIQHDAAAKKVTFRAVSPFFATHMRAFGSILGWFLLSLMVGAGVLASHGFGEVAFAAVLLVALPSIFVLSRGRMIDVGADGLSLKWLRFRRYIPFDDVASVKANEHDAVTITLRSDEKIPLRTGGTSGWDGGEGAALLRDALLRRIHEAMEAHRGRIGPRELATQLASGGRDETTWLADLKKLREGEGGYRHAALREEDLWRLVEDPGAPEDARAAAAVLLRGAEGAKPRLRIAADAVASPRLRVALEAEEEEVVEEALKAYARRSG